MGVTVMDMDMVVMVMDTMDTMVRDLLMLSQDMATTDTDTDMVMAMVMDMAVMVMDTMDTMARDLLMLSQDMANTDTDMAMVMDMDTAMDMVTDTTDKQYKCFLLAV